MNMLADLQKYIEQYDKIIWIEHSGSYFADLPRKFLESEAVKNYSGRMLVLSTEELEFPDGSISYRRLSGEEQMELRGYYRMYDFSNRFQVLSDDVQYGGLMNFVKTGMLEMEEALEAFLDG